MSDLAELRLRPSSGRPPRRRLPKWVGIGLVLAVLLALFGGAALGGHALLSSLRGASEADGDFPGPGRGSVLVEVAEGDTAGDIATRLQDKGVVKSAAAFRSAAAADDRSRSVQPGFYHLRAEMRARDALALLLDPASRARTRVTLPEGVPLSDALRRIADATDVPLKDLQAEAQRPQRLGLPAYARGEVEGFLFPATYDVPPGASAREVLTLVVDRFEEAAADLDLVARARALGRTPYEVVTTASLVEEETAFPTDRAKVARVVYNRLRAQMPLQFDSTVNYVREEKRLRLSLADLEVESAYNTYRNRGLPPTPIASPGEEALEAALSPAQGDYIYFVTVDEDGRSLFTRSYEEFLRAKAKAQREGVY